MDVWVDPDGERGRLFDHLFLRHQLIIDHLIINHSASSLGTATWGNRRSVEMHRTSECRSSPLQKKWTGSRYHQNVSPDWHSERNCRFSCGVMMLHHSAYAPNIDQLTAWLPLNEQVCWRIADGCTPVQLPFVSTPVGMTETM